MSKDTLQSELQTTGASVDEARQLATLANRLTVLKDQLPSVMPERRRPLWLRLAPVLSASIVFLLIGMAVVTTAQTSIPGSLLYPIKRASENTAVALVPSYRATLMMRRADEVKQLVGKQADSRQVLATLADYNTQAADYKSKNYAAFAYCKASLEQAATIATAPEKHQIVMTLANLSDID